MGHKILVVDDSAVIRKVVKKAIHISGLDTDSILEAGNGREALDLLQQEHFDIVLADLNMPVMSGQELIEAMSRDPRLAGIPVIVVSSDRNQARMEALMRHGVGAFLKKPFRPEEFREVIEEALKPLQAPVRSEPHPFTEAAMMDSLTFTLEEAAFVMLERVPEPPAWRGAVVEAHMPFWGPISGRLVLATSPAFALELAGNLLGVDPESVEASKGAHDSVGELLNIYAGALFERAFGKECDLNMGLPTLRTTMGSSRETERAQACCAVTLLGDSGHRLDAEVFVI